MAPLFQTPPLAVARQVIACAECRRKKTKCDGGLPACSACIRFNKADECSNASDEFARGRERSYVTALETLIEKLRAERNLLRNHDSRSLSEDRLEHSTNSDERYLSPQSILYQGSSHEGSTGYSAQAEAQADEKSDVNELTSDFGSLAINATSSGYQGFIREMSFARLLFSTSLVNPLPVSSESAHILPPRQLAVNLIDECQRKLLQFVPIISASSIFRSLNATYQHGGQRASALDSWNLRMVLALGCLCRSTTLGDVQYQAAVAHAAAAVSYREIVIQPGSMASLQALLLLALYSLMDPSHFNAWFVVGVAARVAVDIGLHTDHGADPETTEGHLDLRRRVLYCLYTLDRAVTMTLVRAVSFTDASVQVELPTPLHPARDDLSQAFLEVPPHDPSHDIIRVRRILSEHYQNVFLVTRKSLNRRWPERVPMLNDVRTRVSAVLESSPRSSPLLCAEMHYFSLLLMQPPGAEQALGEYGEVLAFDHAVAYADAIWQLLDTTQAWEECYTSLDLDRSLRVCCWLQGLLDMDYSPALNSPDPVAPAIPPESRIPPLATSDLNQRRSRAATALQQLDQVIEDLGRRFGFPKQGQTPNGTSSAPYIASTAEVGDVGQITPPPMARGPVTNPHLDHARVQALSASLLGRLMTQQHE